MVESLVVEFDQAKYEEFLSSGSKSPKTRVCRRVSTGNYPEIHSVTLSGPAIVANRAKRDTRVNVSQETRVVSGAAAEKKVVAKHTQRDTRVNVSQETRVAKGIQPCPQHQVVVGFSPPPRRNRNAERQQRRHARQLQVGTTDCPTKAGRAVQTSVFAAPHPAREVRVWRPKREISQVGPSEALLPRR